MDENSKNRLQSPQMTPNSCASHRTGMFSTFCRQANMLALFPEQLKSTITTSPCVAPNNDTSAVVAVLLTKKKKFFFKGNGLIFLTEF